MKQYISSEIIPVNNFHTSKRQVIGLKFTTAFPFTGSCWHSTVLPYVIEDGISFILSSTSFNWVTILSFILSSLFIQNTWTPSCPGAFQFGILLHYSFTLPSLITKFYCSNFIISSSRSLNHLASLLCFFLYIPYFTPKCPTFCSIQYVSITSSCFSLKLIVNFLLIHFEQSINPVLLDLLFVLG